MSSSNYHCFQSSRGHHLLYVDGSRVYDIDEDLRLALENGDIPEEIRDLSVGKAYITKQSIEPPVVRSLSLNVSQGCNLLCTYCYADQGRFGTKARSMTGQVARSAVDRFLSDIQAGDDAVLGFMGGEPLLARKLIHSTARYASEEAVKKGVRLRFSITTNATLINQEDARLFSELPFSVQVSLDGDRESNDRIRLAGHPNFASYQAAIDGLAKLLNDVSRPRHVSIRATVTPLSGPLLPILDHLIGLGTDSVGFAPVLVSPKPQHALSDSDFEPFLEQMIACGQHAKKAIKERRPYPFSNFESALQEIAKGTHRPYPCGAGASYLSVNSQGDYYSCHRTIDDPRFRLGSAAAGPDDDNRKAFLDDRHVLNQKPCEVCWARFLCGGGCHHEVVNRGRPACDYVRGWLDFCLASYAELVVSAPGYFERPETFFQIPVEESHYE